MAAKKNYKKIDVDKLLAGVDIVKLIDQYVPLKKSGAEFEACCPFHTEKSPSFKVSPSKQMYHCFGCEANGNAIGFLMEYQGLEFLDAVKQLGGDVEGADPDIPKPVQRESVKADDKVEWLHLSPVPDDAEPPPKAHTYRGKPKATWTYRDGVGRVLGYVCRFEKSDGGKETIPLSYLEHPESGHRQWRWHSFAEPRPLYGIDLLAKRPDAWVLLVEGEKCADAATEFLSILDHPPVVMSWPGGCKAVDKADWSILKGCNVFLWPDCDAKRVPLTKAEKDAIGDDPEQLAAAQMAKPLLPELEQPGVIAMERIAHKLLRMGEDTRARIIRIPPPGEKPDGWDVYDAINADGMEPDQIMAMCRNVRPPTPLDTSTGATAPVDDLAAARAKKTGKQPRTPNSATAKEPPSGGGSGGDDDWFDRLIRKRGDLLACLSNVYDMLSNVPQWDGVLGFDESAQSVVKLNPPPFERGAVGEWEEQDDVRTAMWLSRRFHFSASSRLIAETVETLARDNAFHPIRNWLTGLKWDGEWRLDDWMYKYLGVERSEYSLRVSRWFLMGMVARAMQPGCKFDYCLVLEGEQGLRKSGVLGVLGGAWYGDTDLDLHNKDSMSALRGKWLYEFAEMGSIARAEASKQKSFISRQVDEFRPAYGKREVRCPRQVVFAGTVNEWEWNKDPTGGRRFWPVMITQEIDHTGLAEVRDQLFAEAFHAWESGEKYWPDREEQKAIFDQEQLKRTIQDTYIDLLAEWVDIQVDDFSLAYAITEGLKLDNSKLTRDIQTRVGMVLRQLGCTKIERKNDSSRFVYVPPEKKRPAGNISQQPAQPKKEDDDLDF